MAIVAPNPTQGAALLAGTQAFYSHDNAADNMVASVYSHRPEEFAATEAESWCDFFRAAASAINTSTAHVALTTTAHGGIVASSDSRLTDARTPTAHASSHNSGGGDAMAIDAAAGTGSLRTLGTASTAACAGNDSRLTDARTPTAHASSHQTGGGDALSGFAKWRGVAASDPASPIGGDLYKNSGDSKIYLYDETSWIALT